MTSGIKDEVNVFIQDGLDFGNGYCGNVIFADFVYSSVYEFRESSCCFPVLCTFLHVVDCSSQVAHHVLISCIVLELDVAFRPSGLVLIPLESASVELVPLWAPVFTEVVRVVVVTVVALFIAWGVVLHCTVELAIASPCLHEVH